MAHESQPISSRKVEPMRKLKIPAMFAAAALAAASLLCSTAQAGVLLGTATLEKPDDLTRVASHGGALEFLDLTSTLGWTLDDALFGYAPHGFRVANGDEMRELFGAFGITYVITADYMAELPSSPKHSAALVDYVGATWNGASFGMSYEPARSMLIFSCISAVDCGEPPNYVAMEDYNYGNELLGVYLVRDAALPVPLPATLPLIGIGLLAMAARCRQGRPS